MNNNSINLNLLPFVVYLSSKRILDYKLSNKILVSKENIENLIFLEQRYFNHQLPNYIHKNYQKYLNQENKDFYIFNSLNEIYNYFITNNIKIKPNKFEEWQILITLINPIHILASNLEEKNVNYNFFNSSSILHMETNTKINEFFKKNNFSDLHIHMNGTSEVLFNWQHFLNNPKSIYNSLKYTIHFKQVNFKNVKEIMDLIEMAKYIQENLVYIIKNKNCENEILKFTLDDYLTKKNFFKKSLFTVHPIQILLKETIKNEIKHNIPTYELILFIKIFNILKDESISNKIKTIIQELTHLYLLIYSQFNKLLIQQYDQIGFDQFQMITDNGIRDFYEDLGYKDRFIQLKGIDSTKFFTVEGRFAPKKDILKTYNLVNKAIYDYIYTSDTYYQKLKNKNQIYKYISPKKSNQLNNKNQIKKLSLTAHFIKKENLNCISTYKSNYIELIKCPRHANLRKELNIQANILINLIKTHKGHYINIENLVKHSYVKFINGIDAAGNELYTRPEVFAPTFKLIRNNLKKIKKNIGFTFHAGEDFIHIISGIRYIYEAITFLNMKNFDRIGHATALGIDPYFWQKKLNNKLLIKKGEWLDNLLFLCKILNLNETKFSEIFNYWKDIYSIEYINLKVAYEAYLLRQNDPDKIFNKVKLKFEEIDINPSENAKEIFYKYHYEADTKKEYKKLIEITLSDYLEFIVPLQKEILKFMKEKNIVIEVMPSSNTRISFYDNYEDHHIFKWFDKKNIPDLIIATDDPGIFNTNLKNEYLHLYNILSTKYEKSDEYILNLFNQLRNNSNKYAFK
ncbi:amidohydrolase family protein [Aliarcobacter butzleri]|uniref:hypothetical protein n=1 Tax=Aliarcobacter butzleri TaxID=28197 RepID=UPI0021B3CE24|nr:hypothetical protein [Aliarcobacter butzleri]MCT7567752.1 hypothetical protein [Aliarcobacter butzleri]